MQRLLREILFIIYIITFTFIYGNMIVLLMNKIAKDIPKQLQNNTSLNITTTPNLKIHYPTMLLLLDDDDHDRIL
jgi:hypothetical protein